MWRSSSSRDRRKVLGRRRRRLRGRTYWGQTNTEDSLSSNVEADDLNTANSDGGAGVDGWTDGRMTSVAAAALVLVPTAIWLPTNCRNKSLAHFKIKFISPDCYPRSSCKSVNFLRRLQKVASLTFIPTLHVPWHYFCPVVRRSPFWVTCLQWLTQDQGLKYFLKKIIW